MSRGSHADLERFVSAQHAGNPPIYECALEELRAGFKTSHWIWFVLPQLRGLGHSNVSIFYGISDLTEAHDYLEHSILGARLRETTSVLIDQLAASDKSLTELMGGSLDAAKTVSSLTLFEAAGFAVAQEILDEYGRCVWTVEKVTRDLDQSGSTL